MLSAQVETEKGVKTEKGVGGRCFACFKEIVLAPRSIHHTQGIGKVVLLNESISLGSPNFSGRGHERAAHY